MRQSRLIFQIALVLSDMATSAMAVFIAHRLQRALKPDSVDRFLRYIPFLLLYVATIVLVSYFRKRYHGRRPSNFIDSLSTATGTITIATLTALSALVFIFKSQFDYGELVPSWFHPPYLGIDCIPRQPGTLAAGPDHDHCAGAWLWPAKGDGGR
ncbi:MAG: hypothetical protein GXP38_03975 [Chloroflexi bacterium]|nr:hypothetical protein [Chloroflexota bacterium]